jgi:hypothetical protein
MDPGFAPAEDGLTRWKDRGANWRGRILLAVLLSACGVMDVPADAGFDGPTRDVQILDGTMNDGASDGFVPDVVVDALPDAGPVGCTTEDCDPTAAASCTLGACALAGTAPACFDAIGDAVAGASCSSSLECGRGLACFLTRGGGQCREVCCPAGRLDAPAPCPGEDRCTGTGVLVDNTPTDWRSCVTARECNVLSPTDACDPGEGCYVVTPTGGTDCLSAGRVAAGAACRGVNECEPGFFCAGPTGESTCVRLCDPSHGAAACPESEGTCRRWGHIPDNAGLCSVEAVGTAP